MKINCIHCGHSFPLSNAYDDFEGPVKCPTCRGMLEIRAQDATLKMVRPFSFAQSTPPSTGSNPGANSNIGISTGTGGTFVLSSTQQLARPAPLSQPLQASQVPGQVLPTSYPDPNVIGTVDGTQSGNESPRVAA